MNNIKTLGAVIILGLTLAPSMIDAKTAKAYFTGKQKYVTTVTGQSAVNCEYQYGTQKFWRVFKTRCPSSVDVY